MKTKLIQLVLFSVLSWNSFAQDAKEVAASCMPSTVSLIMEDQFKQPISLGSGFIIDNNKVVTNLHVIEGAKYGTVITNTDQKKFKIDGYLAIDEINDLAILLVSSLHGKSAIIETIGYPEIGERIYAIGNPKGLSGTISEGIVSGIRSLENKSLIQITAPISPGSSGGPVVNNQGKVIGVAVGTLQSGQNLNFAISIEKVIKLKEKMSPSPKRLEIKIGTTKPKNSETEIDVKEGLRIRNIKFTSGAWSSDGVKKHHRLLESFSFKNDTEFQIGDITVLFIIKDSEGIPLHYEEKLYLKIGKYYKEDSGIKPFLAKTINNRRNMYNREFRLEEEGETMEMRILDFKIVE